MCAKLLMTKTGARLHRSLFYSYLKTCLGGLKSDNRIFGYFKGNRTVLQVLGSHVLHSLIQFQGNRTDNCLFESGCT